MRYLIFTLILILLIGCNENGIKFDSSEWKSDKIGHKNVRPNMAKHLIDSKLLIGIKLDSVIKLLGEEYYPIKSELTKQVSFTIKESYGFDIDPLYCSFLIVETDTLTARVLSVRFEETEDKRTFIEKVSTE